MIPAGQAGIPEDDNEDEKDQRFQTGPSLRFLTCPHGNGLPIVKKPGRAGLSGTRIVQIKIQETEGNNVTRIPAYNMEDRKGISLPE